MSTRRFQRGVRQMGGFSGGTSHLARPPQRLPEPDVRPRTRCPRFVARYRDYTDGAVTFGPNVDLTQLLVLHDSDQLTIVDYPSFTEQSTDQTVASSGLIQVNPLGIAPFEGDDWLWWAEREELSTIAEFAVWTMIPGDTGSRVGAYGASAGTTTSIPTWTAVLDLANNSLIVLFSRTFTMTLEVEVIDMDTFVTSAAYGPYDITGLFLSMTGSRATLTPDGAVWFIHGTFPHGVGRWHPVDGLSVVTSGLTDGVRGTSQGLLARPDSSVWAVMTDGSTDTGISVSPGMVVTPEACMDLLFTGVLSSVSNADATTAVVNPFYIEYGEFWQVDG